MIEELDDLIRSSLGSFVEDVFRERWHGREREAVSLYAFGYLAPRCGPGQVLRDATQIGIEVAVPQMSAPNAKQQVCKDLVLWPAPRLTCWNAEGRPTIFPMAVMEWKVNRTSCSTYDMQWLAKYSEKVPGFVGYATCLDLKRREFQLSCARVLSGRADLQWLRV